jgi:hypothetical protein
MWYVFFTAVVSFRRIVFGESILTNRLPPPLNLQLNWGHPLYLGKGPNALEVAVYRGGAAPTIAALRAVWKARLAGRATPLLTVILSAHEAALCGPAGDVAPAFKGLQQDRVERLCRAALAEPDRHSALRFLNSVIPETEAPISGVRNEGLFATHELRYGAQRSAPWAKAQVESGKITHLRDRALIEALGFKLEPHPGPVTILRAAETRTAVAVFLDRNESPDLPSARYAQLSPVSYALAKADDENLDWVVVSTGNVLRLHPVKTGVGTGRRGRAETFFEIHLDLVSPEDVGFLWLIFSGEALKRNGSVDSLLERSSRYAADLGTRLRERVYNDVVPDLAMGILEARKLKRPKPSDLAETYEMALVYLFRLLFVAYAEDKDLLPFRTNPLYRDRSLKAKAQEFAELRTAIPKFGDDSNYWQEIDQIFRAVERGNLAWGVPAYDGGLFSPDDPSGARLAGIALPDRVLAPVLMNLLTDHSPEGWGPVDFRSLGVREFGTIYEGVLENELALAEVDLTEKAGKGGERVYVPASSRDKIIVQHGRAYLHTASGARKSSGSYFTKHFAVEHLLDYSLEPALKSHLARLEALADASAAAQFFDFRVADIAMGSGHFLVAAVDRIERALTQFLARRPLPAVRAELDRLRGAASKALGGAADAVAIEDTQLLRRQIARRCLYGVDVNPMAVSLARLATWIHTFVPGLPLSFLNHNLACGNSLVGIGTLEEANSWMRETFGLFALKPDELRPAAEALTRLAALSDANAAELAEARSAFEAASKAAAPVAAFFDVLSAARLDTKCGEAIHQEADRWLKDLSVLPGSGPHARARKVLADVPPFHFPVAFPEVFLRPRPGFDVIVGNPPWEEATVEEDRFWTRFWPVLHSATAEQRKKRVEEFRREHPELVRLYDKELAEAELLRRILVSGQFPGMGTGDPDLYKAFYWRFWELLASNGNTGVVLPRSAMCAKGSTEFRQRAFREGCFVDLTWLLNNRSWVFEDVHPQYTIVLTSLAKKTPALDQTIPMRGPYRSLEAFEAGVGIAPLRFLVSEVMTWTDTCALPLLPSEDSGEVFLQLRKAPRLDASAPGTWKARPHRELDATNDKSLMKMIDERPGEGYWPVFKGESFDIWQPDTGQYYAWANSKKVVAVLQEKRKRSSRLERSPFYGFPESWSGDPATLPCFAPRIAFRDVSRATDTRTVRAALLPAEIFLTNKAPYFVFAAGDAKDQAYLLAILCSLPLDWYSRRFVEINLNFFILNPFPIPRPERTNPLWVRAVELGGRLAASDRRFNKWAKAVGVGCGALDEAERRLLIAELDAVVAHLYGLTERQLTVIFETFHEGWDCSEALAATRRYFAS